LKWLCESQVFACIPVQGSIAFADVAEMAGVTDLHLYRAVRMVATIGFLHEPQPDRIAHTALSLPLVEDLTVFDSIMFLLQTVLPSALQMTTAIERQSHPDGPASSAYCVAFDTSQPFQEACMEGRKLRREWMCYKQHALSLDETLSEALLRQDWRVLGNAIVVDVSAIH
jgi:hypothetical protein